MSKSKVYTLSDKEFTDLIINSKNFSDVLRQLGLTSRGGTSSKLLKKRIQELNISTEHFSKTNYVYANKKDLEEICIENSTYLTSSKLKKRLLKNKLLKYECSICNLTDWLGKPISLQLDHINGINNDNRLENLRLLCPNCHSQTDTYAGKRLKIEKVKKPRPTKIEWPSADSLKELINNKSYTEIGKILRSVRCGS